MIYKIIALMVLLSGLAMASGGETTCATTYSCVSYAYTAGKPIIVLDPWCTYQNNISDAAASCGNSGGTDHSTTDTQVCSATSIMSSYSVGENITMLNSAVDTAYFTPAVVAGGTELAAYPTGCGGGATSMAINSRSAFFGFYNATQLTTDGWSLLDAMINKVWDNWYSENV